MHTLDTLPIALSILYLSHRKRVSTTLRGLKMQLHCMLFIQSDQLVMLSGGNNWLVYATENTLLQVSGSLDDGDGVVVLNRVSRSYNHVQVCTLL